MCHHYGYNVMSWQRCVQFTPFLYLTFFSEWFGTMSQLSQFTLRMWEPDFGLPTVDPDSLIALTLLKMSKVNLKVTYGSCPQFAAIPSLARNGVNIAHGPEFLEDVISTCNLDFCLEGKSQGLSMAYKRYFLETFEPFFFYNCWIHQANYEQCMRPWYMNASTFPFNFLYVRSRRRQALERYDCIKGTRTVDEFVMELYEAASRCLDDFNNMLSDNRSFILGNIPSTLDAVVYSYVVIALNLPVPDVHLKNTIKNYKHLCQFIRNLTKIYHPELEVKYKYIQPEPAQNERASTLTLLIAAISASTLMLAYAHINGIIRLKMPKINLNR